MRAGISGGRNDGQIADGRGTPAPPIPRPRIPGIICGLSAGQNFSPLPANASAAGACKPIFPARATPVRTARDMMIVGWIRLITFINGGKNGTSTSAGKGKFASSTLTSTSKKDRMPLNPASQSMRNNCVLGLINESPLIYPDNIILLAADVQDIFSSGFANKAGFFSLNCKST